MQDKHESTDSHLLAHHFISLLSTLQSELNRQLSATKTELGQIKNLMDDAIEALVDSFISLEGTTRTGQYLIKQMLAQETDAMDELNPFRSHQTQSAEILNQTSYALDSMFNHTQNHHESCTALASTLTDNAAVNKLSLQSQQLVTEASDVASKMNALIHENANNISLVAAQMSLTTSKIEKDVQIAVKSLQFQDTTSQLIEQCMQRQQLMETVLNEIHALSQTDANSVSSADLLVKINKANEALKQTSAAKMKAFDIDNGSVELFN